MKQQNSHPWREIASGEKLPSNQEEAVAAHRDIEEAARAAGIGTPTFRWAKLPDFLGE